MKRSLKFATVIAIVVQLNATAQTWVDKMHDTTQNFYSIQQEFNSYWQNRPYEKGKGYKAFKRWEWYTEPRVYPSGDLKYGSRSMAMENFKDYLIQNPIAAQKINSPNATSNTGNWTAMGPFGSPIGGDAGRLTFIRFMPGNANTIFVGTGAGGLWVSTNNGASWTTNTNGLAVLGCSDLAIDLSNTSVMYLATGDVDANDTHSIGVLKSTDGGLTWNPTGLTFPVSSARRIGRLLINPLNPNILFASTSSGIYRTNNGGTSWSLKRSGNFTDMEYRPGDTSTVYAVTGSSFFKSTTGGNTPASFVQTTTGITPSGVRMCVSVTPADPNYVYVLNSASDNGYGGVFRSTNSGTSFTSMSTTPNIFGWDPSGNDAGGQGWYDIACGVSPTNKDEIICGGVNTWKSINGGATWTLNSHWYGGGGKPYVHADLHAVEYVNGTTCYLGHDGGISRTTNSGVNWTTINGTMNISQSYRIGQSTTTPNYVLSGHQDNGTNLLNGTTWTEVYGGDGADCFVDRTNNNVMVESYVNGDFNLSNNAGASWTNITSGLTGSAAWVAPIIQSAHVANTYYCGYQQVFKSTNKGSLWTQMGTIPGSGQILYLATAPSNSLVLYAATSANLYKTVNGGTSWSNITTGLPTGSAAITRMTVDNTDADNVFVSFSGYSAANKTFSSNNGGASWSNISTGLPNIPVNCIIYSNNSNDEIYAGTDVGVYFRDGSMTAWVPFMTGLPNVVVNDFEIYYPTGKIRAATYGRGVWQSDLYSDPLSVPNANFSTSFVSACVNNPFLLNDQSSGLPTAWSWTLTGGNPSVSSSKNPTVTYSSPGTYTVDLISTNVNGASAVYTGTILVVQTPTLLLSSTAVCNGQPATLSANGASTYLWSNGSTSSNTSVLPTVTSVFSCTGSVGACNVIETVTVNVGSISSPTITQTGLVLTSSASSGNQWYLNGSPIIGETSQSYTVTQNGYYSVWVSSALGCQSSSSTILINTTGFENQKLVSGISISPNPTKDFLSINSLTKEFTKVRFTIYAVTGQVVKNGELVLNSKETINVSSLPSGVYEIKVEIDQTAVNYKFMKE